MGQRDIRRLLIIGAMAVVRWTSRKGAPAGSWLALMLGRKPRMLVAMALANKMARSIWAMLTKGRITGIRLLRRPDQNQAQLAGSADVRRSENGKGK